MCFLKSIASAGYWLFSIVMIVIGLGIVILALINSPLQLQIALGLIGFGFISMGLVQVKRGQYENINRKRFDQVIAKLDEIQQEFKKEDRPKGTGIAIADVISSGLKYYADQMNKQNEDE